MINVLDSQEAKPYKDDPEIVALTDLVDAYQVRLFMQISPFY